MSPSAARRFFFFWFFRFFGIADTSLVYLAVAIIIHFVANFFRGGIYIWIGIVAVIAFRAIYFIIGKVAVAVRIYALVFRLFLPVAASFIFAGFRVSHFAIIVIIGKCKFSKNIINALAGDFRFYTDAVGIFF